MKKFCIFLSLISIGVHAQNQITTAEQLQAVNENLSGSYILMNDIDLSDYTDFIPIGGETGSFTGTFDGNGHSIKIFSSIFKSASSGYYDLGLFTVIGIGGLVKNLKITGAVSNRGYHKERLGGIAGTNKGTITNCSVGAQISI